MDQNEIKEFIQGKGIMAPVIYVALLSSLPLLLFPDSVLVIAGGMDIWSFGDSTYYNRLINWSRHSILYF